MSLTHRAHALPATLSGGEQQRVAIARAVIGRPELLVADEPTGNVDTEMASRLITLFEALNKLGTTIVVATHDYELIFKVGNAQDDAPRARAARRFQQSLAQRHAPVRPERPAMSSRADDRQAGVPVAGAAAAPRGG